MVVQLLAVVLAEFVQSEECCHEFVACSLVADADTVAEAAVAELLTLVSAEAVAEAAAVQSLVLDSVEAVTVVAVADVVQLLHLQYLLVADATKPPANMAF